MKNESNREKKKKQEEGNRQWRETKNVTVEIKIFSRGIKNSRGGCYQEGRIKA